MELRAKSHIHEHDLITILWQYCSFSFWGTTLEASRQVLFAAESHAKIEPVCQGMLLQWGRASARAVCLLLEMDEGGTLGQLSNTM